MGVSILEGIIIYANAMEFIYMNVHPRLLMNLYLTCNLILVHSQLVSS